MVFIFCSRMKDVFIRQPLDIAYVQDHVQLVTHAHIFQDLESLQLLWGERWDQALVGESGE